MILAALAMGAIPSTVQAQPATGFAALEAGLSSDDAPQRAAALSAYGALSASDVPNIRERLRTLRSRRADPLETTRVLAAFRHAVGSRRADDAVDIGPGVALTLAETRDPLTVRIGAAILMERAAERIGTTEALACVTEIAAWTGDGMRLEARRIAVRVGPALAPIVIAARSHEQREARQWAEWTAAQLGLEEPGRFVSSLSPELVPDVLVALARAHVMAAVPVAASFIDARRSSTRAAAREALTIYGQNSIWVAREAYRIRVGEPPDAAWGWRRTLDALFSAIDSSQEVVLEADLARATAALDIGDRQTAATSLHAALRLRPDPVGPAAGSALLRLAELDLGADDLEGARRHLAAAGRLPIEARDAPHREAVRELLRGEEYLTAGVLDADAYARGAAIDASCGRCAELHARFDENEAGTARPTPWVLWLAAAAFLAFALLLWPARSGRPRTSEPAVPAGDGANATLPG